MDWLNLREFSTGLVSHRALTSLSIWNLFGLIRQQQGGIGINDQIRRNVDRIRRLFRDINFGGVRLTYLGLHGAVEDIQLPFFRFLLDMVFSDSSLPFLTTLNISIEGGGVMDIYPNPAVQYEVPPEGDFYDNLIRRAQVLIGAPTFADAEGWLADNNDNPPLLGDMESDEHRDVYCIYRHLHSTTRFGSILGELLHAPSSFAHLYARGWKETFKDMDIRNLQRAKYAIYF